MGGQVAMTDMVLDATEPQVQGASLGLFYLIFFLGGAVGALTVGGLGEVLSLRAAVLVLAVVPGLGVGLAGVGHRRFSAGR